MQILENYDITAFSTMRLPAKAEFFVEVNNENELLEVVKWAKSKQLPFRVIGGGSNIFFGCELLQGLFIVNRIKGISREGNVITANAGENWDDLVEYAVNNGLYGIESMSLIPGSVGAAPVQNIGAYGQQLSDVFVSLRALDLSKNQYIEMRSEDCQFGYRTSIFKNADQQNYVITQVKLKFENEYQQRELYKDLQIYLDNNNLEQTAENVRKATIAVRQAKLPDPKQTANNGSFFANPVISLERFEEIAEQNPEINQTPPGWPQPPRWIDGDKVKISAGWLIDQIGYTNYQDNSTGMRTWPTQSLVLVNENAKSPADLQSFRDDIINKIKTKFGIQLIQEPEEICMKRETSH